LDYRAVQSAAVRRSRVMFELLRDRIASQEHYLRIAARTLPIANKSRTQSGRTSAGVASPTAMK
jgi:hypothetical protein